MIQIRPARLGEAVYVGRNLRSEDEREVWAATGRLPSRVLADSFLISSECLCLFDGDAPLPFAICGVSPDPEEPEVGVVWMLCTAEVSRCTLSLAKLAPALARRLGRGYPRGMHNLAHKPNYLHVRWCRLAGFVELGEYEQNGHTFIHIYRRPDECVQRSEQP